MENPGIAFKTISKASFFDLYNDLSARDKPLSPKTSPKTPQSAHLSPKSKSRVPRLQVYSQSPEVEESSPKPLLPKTRPPSELIAVDIPLKPSEETADFGDQSHKSLDFHSSFRSSNFYESFNLPKVPKSLNSFEKASRETSSLKIYMEKLRELEGFEESTDPIIVRLENTKLNSFDDILELIFCECSLKVKANGCLFVKCSRDGKILESQKLDFFYSTLGGAAFDSNKLLHRNLLKKYLFEVTQSQEVPGLSLWKKIGFPQDVNDFLSQRGSPLSLIIAIHILEMITFSFWKEILDLGVPFLDICFQLAIEAYQMSKISKLKNYFSSNIVPNYFKLTTAAVLNFFMVKTCRVIDNYELLQKTVEQMRDNHIFLLQSVDPSILKPFR
jgi:hypothetical protein